MTKKIFLAGWGWGGGRLGGEGIQNKEKKIWR